MKIFKILFVAVILTLFVGVTQTKAQAYILRGTESPSYEPFGTKPLLFEIDGVEYFAWAEMEFQFEFTPSSNLNWSSHGHITEVYLNGVLVEGIEFKKIVNVRDARPEFDDKITITPNGKVNVTNHLKDFIPFW